MSDVHIRTEGRAGRITLTRPEALNALSYEMSLAILDALDRWADDDAVALVILDAEGGRAFCAGGDLARIHADATGNKGRETVEFWRHEYELNDRIATYRSPSSSSCRASSWAAASASPATPATASQARRPRSPCRNAPSD